MRHTLTPTNEGQDLNYVEGFNGTNEEALERAEQIIRGLTKVLPRGDFGCRVEADEQEAKPMELTSRAA